MNEVLETNLVLYLPMHEPDGSAPHSVGEARIYSRALTLPEIRHNYLATKWRYQ